MKYFKARIRESSAKQHPAMAIKLQAIHLFLGMLHIFIKTHFTRGVKIVLK